jgi:protein TonB
MIRRDRLGSLGVVIAAHLVLALVLLYSLRTTTRRVPAADVVVMLQMQTEPPAAPPPPQPVAKPLVPATPDLPLIAPAMPVAAAAPPAPAIENIQENAAPSAPPQPKAHLELVKESPVAAEDGGPSADASAAGNPKPVYPKISRSLGEQGRVLLDVYVQADGSVGEIRLHQSCGYDRLDESALHAVRQWRFKPARQAGKQIAAWYVQPITFSLQSA